MDGSQQDHRREIHHGSDLPPFFMRHIPQWNFYCSVNWRGEIFTHDLRLASSIRTGPKFMLDTSQADVNSKNVILFGKNQLQRFDWVAGKFHDEKIYTILGKPSCCKLLPDNRGIVMGTQDGKLLVRYFEPRVERENVDVFDVYRNSHVAVTSVDVLRNENFCYDVVSTTTMDGQTTLWNLSTSKKLYELPKQGNSVTMGEFSRDGDVLVTTVTQRYMTEQAKNSNFSKILLHSLDLQTLSREHTSLESSIVTEVPHFGEQKPTADASSMILQNSYMCNYPKSTNFFFDRIRRQRLYNGVTSCEITNFNLPEEMIRYITDFLPMDTYPIFASVCKMFRDCILERKCLVLDTVLDKFTFVNSFKQLDSLIVKNNALLNLKHMTTSVERIKHLTIVSLPHVASVGVDVNFLERKFNVLESLRVYHSNDLLLDGMVSVKKLHLIQCQSKQELVPNPNVIQDLSLRGSMIDLVLDMEQVPNLMSLDLSSTKISDWNFEKTNVRVLFLENCKKSQLTHLKWPKQLDYLNISASVGLNSLVCSETLTQLVMNFTSLSEKTLQTVLENCPALKSLSIKQCSDLQSPDIRHKKLTSLSMYGTVWIEELILMCPELIYLNLGKTRITDENLEQVVMMNSSLQQLHTCGCVFLLRPFTSRHFRENYHSDCLTCWSFKNSCIEEESIQSLTEHAPHLKLTI